MTSVCMGSVRVERRERMKNDISACFLVEYGNAEGQEICDIFPRDLRRTRDVQEICTLGR